jgi:hypothetical protein
MLSFEWKQQERLDGTWQTKGRYCVWKTLKKQKESIIDEW